MAKDKYKAVWVSHTSMSDFLACPRAYYLKNVYKDPKTNHKMKIMSPALALGQAVHGVLEGLSILPTETRFKISLLERFDKEWEKVTGKKGGFTNPESEFQYKKEGQEMLRRVMENPGPLKDLAIKIKQDLPYYWLSDEDNIILCGKVDWLEYLQATDSVHIIDFKTGKHQESESSLQLPIYHLLVHNCQNRKVDRASYWYLRDENGLVEHSLPDLETAHEKVLKVARDVKLARQLEKFDCPKGADGCFACKPFEKILDGEAEFVGNDEYHYDVYIVDKESAEPSKESVIL